MKSANVTVLSNDPKLQLTPHEMVLDYGIVKIILGQTLQLRVHPNDRLNNKQQIVDIERIMHDYIGSPIDATTAEKFHNEIKPIVDQMVEYQNIGKTQVNIRPATLVVEK